MQLIYFESAPFIDALKQFFNSELNLPLHYLADAPAKPEDMLGQQYKPQSEAQQLMEDVYALGIVDDAVFSDGKSTFDNIEQVRDHQKQYDGILILGVTLRERKNGLVPARGQLAEITRALNREFTSMPVVVVFQYAHYIAFANCERSAYKQSWREGEKAGRVSLLRDIDIRNVHAGHQRILQGLTVPTSVNSFESLYQYWQKALDVSILNKDFYRDLSNWFFAACKEAKFPDPAENAVERGLIRLITRLIFTWFVKERGLVPEKLFDTAEITTLLNNTDGNSDTYYRAVLQNLFFATLNTEMGKRRFRDNKRDLQNRNKDYGMHQYFRYESTFTDSQKWLDVVKDVPFLNGGLFECLDPEDKDGQRVDGFSDDPKRQAHLPNKLFWGDNWIADLSDIYNSKRQKAAEVKPLLNLLHSYKFTVTENTPLEEDVALDPELLGKVFENLLASYNPETRTTARKQTGSFYTPREIVNYMVEEALHAYLEPTASGAKTGEGEDALKVLLSDADARHAGQLGFSETQIRALVEAIQRCTILDPACGSGAFPMGALSKMVVLLGKLDPDNEIWLTSQLAAVDKALEATGADKSTIAEAKRSVREAFSHNDPDYARKLYLIERCLFGVDIQPIALQITKLRFFIALIIDQKIDDTKPNRNIRALPNLETKFVAANTLIALPSQEQKTLADIHANAELDVAYAKLAAVRYKHIAPKSRAEKKRLEKEDKRLRGEIETLMKEAGFGDALITPLVNWNPYDQNAVAPFFDPARMFGPEMADGFDIVIGNPPYGAELSKSEQKHLEEQFKKLKTTTKNSAIYFIYKSENFLKPQGTISFIVPKSLCYSLGWSKCAEFLLPNLSKLLDVGKAFENVKLEMVIFVFDRTKKMNAFVNGVHNGAGLEELHEVPKKIFAEYKVLLAGQTQSEIELILRMSKSMPCCWGDFVTSERGLNWQAKVSQYPGKTPVHRGAQLFPYYLADATDFIDLNKFKHSDYEYQLQPKILNQLAIAHVKNPYPHFYLQAFLDEENRVVFETISCSFVKNSDVSSKFLLGVNNSKLFAWLLYKFIYSNAIRSTRYDDKYVSRIPTPNFAEVDQQAIAARVEQILAAKAHDPAADVSTFEREIDELVADLYGLDDAEKQLVGIRSRE